MRIFKIALLVLFATATVLGTAGSATASTTAGCTTDGFRDDRPSGGFFRYSPDWVNLSNYNEGNPKEDTISYTNLVTKVQVGWWGYLFDDKGIVKFDLTCRNSFDFFYTKAPNRNIADVYAFVPSQNTWRFVTSVDQYAPQIQWQSSTRVRNLPSGTTVVAIVNSGKANPNNTASFKYIDLDGITPR